ncbi:sodium- and chloride-dependent glycine transporter 1-like [Haliotis cracherodii]|uniref:sodium- and chloride-dependent glycine transporter 1-like n=1 Tax=Haliotis cracherodii TaxID=6455 RepID=UPI0039EA1490
MHSTSHSTSHSISSQHISQHISKHISQHNAQHELTAHQTAHLTAHPTESAQNTSPSSSLDIFQATAMDGFECTDVEVNVTSIIVSWKKIRSGGGNVMVWVGLQQDRSRLILVEENLNEQRYRDEIINPVVLLFLRRNGPGAFLIPYFMGIITCSVPLFFLEITISQFSSRSAAPVWVLCPLFKGIGISQVLTSSFGGVLYNVIISWSMYYIYTSFWSVLPWTTCDNWWNTPMCVSKLGNVSSISETHVHINAVEERLFYSAWRKSNVTLTASEEFWQYGTLRVSSGIDNFGSVQVHLLLCNLASWVVAFLCLMKGVRSVGKVLYVTALLPYMLLTVLLIRSCMMPGAGDGIIYFFRTDFSRLASVQVWLEALLQGFYSTGVTYGGLITMSSYNNFNNRPLKDLVLVTVIGEASSIFCGLVVFSTLGFMAHQAQVLISEVVSSGSGLGFIIFPEAIAQLPVSHLWAVLFFLMLFMMGIDSMFGPAETIIAGIIEACPKYLQERRMCVTAGVCLVGFVLSIPFVTEGGIFLFQLIEWYSSSFSTLLIGCLECVVINWIYGSNRLSNDIEMMAGRRFPVLLKLLSLYLTPFILFASLICSLFLYDPPSYGEFIYPEYARVIGIMVAVVMSLPIPITFVYQVVKRKGSLCERLSLASRLSPEWGPSRAEDREIYLQNSESHPQSVIMRIISRTRRSP